MKRISQFTLLTMLCCLVIMGAADKKVNAQNYNLWDMSTWQTVSSGSTGGFVSAVQANLWASAYQTVTGPVDGIFGSGTDEGVRFFQSSEGLASDGIVGTGTWGTFDSYTIDGVNSRTYDHPASSVYTVYYTTYTQPSGFSYTEGSLDEYGIPTGTAFTLWTNNNSLQNNIQTTEDNIIQNPLMEEDYHSVYDTDLHKEKIENNIAEIESSDFNVNLPNEESMNKKMIDINKKDFRNDHELVMTKYGKEGDFSKGKWDIAIVQEKLDNQEEAVDHYKNTIGSKKELEEYTIKNNPAFIHVTGKNEKGLSTIWIVTNNYGYSIASPNATKQELINIAESIDY